MLKLQQIVLSYALSITNDLIKSPFHESLYGQMMSLQLRH